MTDLVNSELAKLLKEKGFDLPVNNYFSNNCNEQHFQPNYKANYNYCLNVGLTHSRPTIAEVLIWLYENYSIWINADPIGGKWYWSCFLNEGNYETKQISESLESFNSPTEAYQAAIEYVLTKLINQKS